MDNKIAVGRSSPIDQQALQQWLQQNLVPTGSVALHSVQVPATGYSAVTVLIDADVTERGVTARRNWVLRLEKLGQHVFLDTSIVRQGQMMMRLAGRGIPAPNVLAIERDPSVLGGAFLIMDRVKGVSLPQLPNYQIAGLLTQLTPIQRGKVWGDALATIASINRSNWRDGFEFLNKSHYGEPGLDQYLRWVANWRDEAMNAQPNRIIDAALQKLQQEKPDIAHVDVLWGDSNPGNFIFTEQGAVAAVLDFEAAALGPAEIDLGWWLFMDDFICFGSERLAGLPGRTDEIALFELALGRKVTEIIYFELLGAVRMALVLARTANLMIKAGRLAATNKAACNNPVTQWLASKLEINCEPMDEDFHVFATAMNTN
jgi:aminoglycoside phosphotransferase (APT) family kinase protein